MAQESEEAGGLVHRLRKLTASLDARSLRWHLADGPVAPKSTAGRKRSHASINPPSKTIPAKESNARVGGCNISARSVGKATNEQEEEAPECKRAKRQDNPRCLYSSPDNDLYEHPDNEALVMKLLRDPEELHPSAMPAPYFLKKLVYAQLAISSLVHPVCAEYLVAEGQLHLTLPRFQQVVALSPHEENQSTSCPLVVATCHLFAHLQRLHQMHRLCHLQPVPGNMYFDQANQQYVLSGRGGLHVHSDSSVDWLDLPALLPAAYVAPEFFLDEYDLVFPDHAYFVEASIAFEDFRPHGDHEGWPGRQRRLKDLRKADVYALGMALMELALGYSPVSVTGTYHQRPCAALRASYPRLCIQLREVGVPCTLALLLAHCVHPNPFRRPFAAEVLGYLRQHDYFCTTRPPVGVHKAEWQQRPFASEIWMKHETVLQHHSAVQASCDQSYTPHTEADSGARTGVKPPAPRGPQPLTPNACVNASSGAGPSNAAKNGNPAQCVVLPTPLFMRGCVHALFQAHLASAVQQVTVEEALALRRIMECVVIKRLSLHVFFYASLLMLRVDWSDVEETCPYQGAGCWEARAALCFFLAWSLCHQVLLHDDPEVHLLLGFEQDDPLLPTAWQMKRPMAYVAFSYGSVLQRPCAYTLLCDVAPDFGHPRGDCLRLLMEIAILMYMHPTRNLEHTPVMASTLLMFFQVLRDRSQPNMTQLFDYRHQDRTDLFVRAEQIHLPFRYSANCFAQELLQ